MGIKYRKVFDFTWKSNRSWSYTRTLLVFSFVFKVIKILQSPIFVAMSVLKSPYRKKIKIAYTRLYTFIYRYVCVYKFGELWKIYTKICHSFMKYFIKNHFLIVGKNQWENRIAESVELISNNKSFILTFLMYQRLNFALFYFTILYWFCHTLTWIHHGCIQAPNPETPSQLPPPTPYHLSGSSPSSSPKHPVSWIEHRLALHFLHDSIHVSMPFSQIIPPSPSPSESKSLFYTSVSPLLSRIQGHHYHLSKFRIYVSVYCIGVFLSGLLHSV